MKQLSRLLMLALVAYLVGCSGSPKTVEELTVAGDNAFTSEKYTEARGFYQQGLLLKPSDRHLLYFTGMTFRREKQFDSALAYIKRADLLHPGDRELNLEIHDLARETNEYRYAIEAIKTLIATGDQEQPYWAELAELYAKDSSPMMTYYYQKLIVDQHPKAPEEYMRFVNVALAIESVQVATDYVDSAIVQFGERNELLANKAYILAYQRKYGEAEALFRRIVEADSTMFGYRLGLANVLSMTDDRKKLAESLEQFRRLKAMPGSDQFNVDSLITELEDRLK